MHVRFALCQKYFLYSYDHIVKENMPLTVYQKVPYKIPAIYSILCTICHIKCHVTLGASLSYALSKFQRCRCYNYFVTGIKLSD